MFKLENKKLYYYCLYIITFILFCQALKINFKTFLHILYEMIYLRLTQANIVVRTLPLNRKRTISFIYHFIQYTSIWQDGVPYISLKTYVLHKLKNITYCIGVIAASFYPQILYIAFAYYFKHFFTPSSFYLLFSLLSIFYYIL